MKIIDGVEGKILELDGVKCVARLSANEDPEYRRDELADLFSDGAFDEIAQQCLDGSRDVAETKAFIVAYIEHFDEIREAFESDRKLKLEKQIANLQTELEAVKLPPAYYEMADLIKGMADKHSKDAERYRKWQQDYKETSAQYLDYESKAKVCDEQAANLMAEYEALYKKCDEMYEIQAQAVTLKLNRPRATKG